MVAHLFPFSAGEMAVLQFEVRHRTHSWSDSDLLSQLCQLQGCIPQREKVREVDITPSRTKCPLQKHTQLHVVTTRRFPEVYSGCKNPWLWLHRSRGF